jgi:SNF2 family DNA or RNA helicase
MFERLYAYQRDGVQWLWKVVNGVNGIHGGILGDDMGLGKTFQVVSLITGMARRKARRTAVLVIVPVSLLATWEAELQVGL